MTRLPRPALIAGLTISLLLPTMETLTLTQADHGRQVTVRVGDTICLQLPENPTTGYRWAVDSVNNTILSPAGDDYAGNADARIGGGGNRQLLFRATQPGQTGIALKLWREWTGDASVTQRFSTTVRVQD